MFNFSASLEINKGMCHISGVSFYELASDLNKFYGTSVMSKYMFHRTSWDNFKMSEFFLVELHYVISRLLQQRTLRSNRKRLDQLRLLIEEKTWFKNTIYPISVPYNGAKIAKLFKKKPFEKQQMFLERYATIKSSYHLKGLLLDSVAGSGKAQPLSAMVKIPGGWTTMGQIKIDDLVVTPSGDIAPVIGTYPQGITEVYQITTEDGRKTKCHPAHLWTLFFERRMRHGGTEVFKRTCTTEKLISDFDKYTVYLPLLTDIKGTAKTTKGFRQIAYELMETNTLISDKVLELPHDSRVQIIRIIMSDFGHVVGSKVIVAETESVIAANNFRKLIWSIGGSASLRFNDEVFRISIKYRDIESIVDFGHEHTNIHSSRARNARLKIVDIKKVEPEATKCIAIDHPDHLYITDDYLVTHNTFTSLAWAESLNDLPTVAIVPKGIVDSVWIEQIETHYQNPPSVWTSLSNKPLAPGYKYYIIHYEWLTSHVDEIIKFVSGEVKRLKGQFKLLLDESHNMNDVSSSRSQAIVKLGDSGLFSDTLPGSGTPLKALAKEAYVIMCLIDPLFVGKVRKEFLDVYGRSREKLNELLRHRIGRSKYTIPELTGMEKAPPNEQIKVSFPGSEKYTLKAIRLQMQSYIHERVNFYKKNMPEFVAFYNEVINDYEKDIRGNETLEKELRKYKTIVNRFRSEGYNSFYDSEDSKFCKSVEEKIETNLRGAELKEFRNVKSAVKYLNLKLTGEALGNVLGKARMNAVRDIITHADLPKLIDNVEKKTLIFTSYVDVLHATVEHLTKAGYNPLMIYGGTSNERLAILKRFREDPSAQVLVATFDSLKEGEPVLAANQEIFLNVPFRDYEMIQAKARIWRTGQDSQCFFWSIDLDTGNELNITSRSIDIMEWSAEQVNQLLPKDEGNALFGNVSGMEMYEMSLEAYTLPRHTSNSLLSLF